ncbi:MAG: hypothetical protein KDK71_03800 [Chlamydiia bacterium]|nr:hypothetical protein [Chlamydiia bacterium]MCB9093118.1 hypothetical protein [Halobacteriovoraceae bacterium]
MTSSSTKKKKESQPLSDLAELAQKGAIVSEIESLWKELLGCSMEETLKSREFKKKGLASLIKHVEDHASESPERDSLLERLNFIHENNDRLINILDANKKRNVKIRHAGHFIDQKLKYKGPEQNQMTIFEAIESNPTKEKIEKYGIAVTSVGVKLTPPEDKLLGALQKLLHVKSQNLDPNSPDYYKGNVEASMVPFGKEKKESPRIRIKPGELYRAYLDSDRYSGLDIKFIKETLMNLSAKKFLMIFDRKRQVEQNGKIKTLTDRIEEFQSLIQVIKYTEGMEDSELAKASTGDDTIFEHKGELIIGFNPILVEQINSKYIEYPSDISKRMVLAAGGHHKKVTQAMIILRDYMLRELSSKRTKVEINKDRLAHQLQLHNYIETRQKKRIEKIISDAIQTLKNLGLIISAELVEGSLGQLKYVFLLNSSFE